MSRILKGPPRQRERPYRDEPYRRYRAEQPCEACGYSVRNEDGYITQAAHITVGNYARGLKPSDKLTISLCPPTGAGIGCHMRFDADQEGFTKRVWGITVDERKAISLRNWEEWDHTRR